MIGNHVTGRSRRARVAAIALVAGVFSISQADLAHSQSAADIVARTKPGVAFVFSRLPNGNLSTGTGFVVRADGLVITAYHIFEQGGRPGVIIPGDTPRPARLVASDPDLDVAVLKISRTNLRALRLGDSSSVRAGDEIVVIGYPLANVLGAYEITVNRGIVSSIRADRAILQIDAAVNPGNSGGPVINSRGEVIGIVRSKLRDAVGVNFAISINAAKPIIARTVAPGVALQRPEPPGALQINPDSVVIRRGDPIIIGYWLLVEGPDKDLGIDSRRGIELAISERDGKLLDHPIRLVGENEGCTATEGERAAGRLAATPALIAAIGSSCSSAAVPGAPILWRVRIPTVSPSNTSPLLTDASRGAEYSGYLRTAHNDLVQGRIAARFAFMVLRARRAATIHDGSPYSERLQAEFTRAFRQLGGEMVAREMISPADTDAGPVLGRIAAQMPDVLYSPVFLAAGSLITRQSRSTPGLQDAHLILADAMMSPDFLRAAGPVAEGVFITSPDFSPDAMGPRYPRLMSRYASKYGAPSSAFHAHAYDAAAIILAAIEKVARRAPNGTLVIDRVAVRNALFATRNFAGATGILTCDRLGDCADLNIAVYKVSSSDPSTWNPGVNPRKLFP